ncbi:MAG: hypothetical protein MI810_22890 [Flavobacteriales bacterium]|nr:hypothetical protein [Flavobacteriales bacterium]
MKNKVLNRILLIVVPLIWGKYIYDLYQNHQLEEELDGLQADNQFNYAPQTFNKDTFELQLPNWDPFLNEQKKTPSEKKSNSQNQNASVQVKKKVVKEAPKNKVWPIVEYYGFVRNRDQDRSLCMLKINGQNKKLGVGQSYQELKVLNVYHDSVLLMFQGERRTIRKGR